jgi:prepilin-type N-terminal cleavage/methylation domain-containing protein
MTEEVICRSTRRPDRFSGGSGRRSSGFTLAEMLVAIAVISVAATVFMSLFFSSMGLAATARDRTIATALAQEELGAILRQPEQYQWQVPAAPSLDLFPIKTSADEPTAGNPVDWPKQLLAIPQADTRQKDLYAKFRWQAYGRLASTNAAYCEVTVVLRWAEKGRPQMLALTSSVPRFVVEALPAPAAAPAAAPNAEASST